MRLFVSPTSPYARKVRVVVLEKGLADAVETVELNPLDVPAELLAHAPLGKVPALLLADGRVLFDSPVICAYLDTVGGSSTLVPAGNDARFDTLVREALADGIMDAGLAIVMERRRPPEQRSDFWVGRWTLAIRRSIAHAQAHLPPTNRWDIGDIALAVALAYIDFRLADLDWDADAPRLRAWLTGVQARSALMATAH